MPHIWRTFRAGYASFGITNRPAFVGQSDPASVVTAGEATKMDNIPLMVASIDDSHTNDPLPIARQIVEQAGLGHLPSLFCRGKQSAGAAEVANGERVVEPTGAADQGAILLHYELVAFRSVILTAFLRERPQRLQCL